MMKRLQCWAIAVSAFVGAVGSAPVGWVHEQVLSGRRPALEDLFPNEAFALELPFPRMHEIDYKF